MADLPDLIRQTRWTQQRAKVNFDHPDSIDFKRMEQDLKTLLSGRPVHSQFVEPTKRFAELIIPEGGHNRVAIDLLTTKIAALLADVPTKGAASSP